MSRGETLALLRRLTDQPPTAEALARALAEAYDTGYRDGATDARARPSPLSKLEECPWSKIGYP